MATIYNTTMLPGWSLVLAGVAHPDRSEVRGDLWQCAATGIYRLACGGVLSSVPQRWARGLAVTIRVTDATRAAFGGGVLEQGPATGGRA